MDDIFAPKNANNFHCNCCDFKCSKNCDWVRHISTRKHKNNDKPTINDDKITQKNADNFQCICGRVYKHRQGLWNHKKRCQKLQKQPEEKTENQLS